MSMKIFSLVSPFFPAGFFFHHLAPVFLEAGQLSNEAVKWLRTVSLSIKQSAMTSREDLNIFFVKKNGPFPASFWISFSFLDSLIELIDLQCSNNMNQERRRKSNYHFMTHSLEIA